MQRSNTFIFILIPMVSTLSFAQSDTLKTSKSYGEVIDIQNGNSIPNTKIYLTLHNKIIDSTFSDSLGNFDVSINDIKNSNYRILAFKSLFKNYSLQFPTDFF